MTNNRFWSFFGPHLLILLLCLLVLGGFAWSNSRNAFSREWRALLETQSGLAARLVVGDHETLKPPGELQEICETLLRRENLRLTVIAPDGTVLADSSADRETMHSHAGRPEFVEALRAERGYSERYSRTLRDNLHYFARRVSAPDGRPLAVVRVAGERRLLMAPVRRAQRLFLLLLTGLAVTALAASYLAGRRITRPVAQIQAGLRRMGQGDLDHRLAVSSPPHLGQLAGNINAMGEQLQRQLRKVRAEQSLREGVLQSLREGVLALDRERRIVLINKAARKLLQLVRQDPTGRHIAGLAHCADLSDLLDAVETRGAAAASEIQLPGGGPVLWAKVSPWQTGEGLREGALVVLSDLTPIRRLERIRRDFVANVSHELRTPVTAIKGFAETLLEEPAPTAEDRRRFLEIIRRQADAMEAILSDMLMLARLEEEGKSLPMETIEVPGLLERARENCAHKAAARKVRIECRVTPPGLTIEGHAHLLEQALVNLIDNAVKYGGEERPVAVTATRDAEGVSLSVRDHGPGIPPEQAQRVFERFYRIDSGRDRAAGGSGLGLSVVKHVAAVHGGTTSIRNAPGGGSVFTISLPDRSGGQGPPRRGEAMGRLEA